MDPHSDKQDRAPRKAKPPPRRLEQKTVVWGRELARRAKVQFSEDEFDDMLAGEEDARAEMEADELDDGQAEFEALSAECDEIMREVDELFTAAQLPADFTSGEVALITAARDAAAKASGLTDPDGTRAGLAQLQQALATSQAARDQRAEAARRVEAARVEEEARKARLLEQLRNDALKQKYCIVAGALCSRASVLAKGFEDAYDTADQVLQEWAGQTFDSVDAIRKLLAADSRVIAAMAEGAKLRLAREEKARQDDEKRKDILYRCEIGNKTVPISRYDILHGTWAPVLTKSDGSARTQPDWGLTMTVGGMEISFHIHPPMYDGGKPVSGGFKAPGQNPGLVQTPDALIPIILGLRGRPKEWG